MFLDLAIQRSPSVLLTRDRALLHLSAGAARLDVRIVTPAQFAAWAPIPTARPDPADARPEGTPVPGRAVSSFGALAFCVDCCDLHRGEFLRLL
jgi:hypothetical protein